MKATNGSFAPLTRSQYGIYAECVQLHLCVARALA